MVNVLLRIFPTLKYLVDIKLSILNKNFSKEIEICRTPIGLLKELEEYKKNNPKKVTVKYYDFKTNKEIEQNEE